MELYRLADNCDYGALRDEMICDRLVVGIRDMALSQQLQLDAELTLEKAKTKVRQREAVGEQQRELKGDPTSLAAFGACRHTRGKWPTGPPHRSSNPKGRTKKCMHCGNKPHPRAKCPAKDATCHRCGKQGHYGSQCRTKRVAEITDAREETSPDTAFLDTVDSEQKAVRTATIQLNKQPTKFKLDTGTEVTAISEKTYQDIHCPTISKAQKKLYGPSHQALRTLGTIKGTLAYKGKTTMQDVYVIEGLKTNLSRTPSYQCSTVSCPLR